MRQIFPVILCVCMLLSGRAMAGGAWETEADGAVVWTSDVASECAMAFSKDDVPDMRLDIQTDATTIVIQSGNDAPISIKAEPVGADHVLAFPVTDGKTRIYFNADTIDRAAAWAGIADSKDSAITIRFPGAQRTRVLQRSVSAAPLTIDKSDVAPKFTPAGQWTGPAVELAAWPVYETRLRTAPGQLGVTTEQSTKALGKSCVTCDGKGTITKQIVDGYTQGAQRKPIYKPQEAVCVMCKGSGFTQTEPADVDKAVVALVRALAGVPAGPGHADNEQLAATDLLVKLVTTSPETLRRTITNSRQLMLRPSLITDAPIAIRLDECGWTTIAGQRVLIGRNTGLTPLMAFGNGIDLTPANQPNLAIGVVAGETKAADGTRVILIERGIVFRPDTPAWK